MPEGGDLVITTRLKAGKDRVEIMFCDTGVGIKKEHLAKIYDPFFTTRKVGEGTGLGLSVSYAIIKKFGGTISCESSTAEEDPMKESGTTFTITLPIATPMQEETPEPEVSHAREDSYS
jgi:signal transduction histidine kinase